MSMHFQQSGLFASPDSIDDVIKWCERFSGGERVATITAAMMMYNVMAKLANKAIEQDKKEDN